MEQQSKVIVVMGVSGCGKTTVGKRLAAALDLPFYDADDFHPQANIDKMASGQPLKDEDRYPWLDTLSRKAYQWQQHQGAVLACSALREDYRSRLSSQVPLQFIFLEGDYETIYKRMQARNHFMKPSLLQSQFNTLEPPKDAFTISVNHAPETIVSKIIDYLSHSKRS